MHRLLPLLFLLALTTCAPAPANDWVELDLTPYDIPLSILAPDSVVVKNSNLGSVMQDVTVTAPLENYAVQIFSSQAATNDLARLKAEQLELVRDNRYFERVVEENPDGFIYENRIDSTAYYGFRHIVYQGDREFVFQNGMASNFGLEEVREIYRAVRNSK